MADANASAQEKTEQATPHRRLQAREDGKIPRSTELSAALVILGGAAGGAFLGGDVLTRHARTTLQDSLGILAATPLEVAGASTLIQHALSSTVLALLPLLLTILVPVLLVDLIQARGVMSLKPLAPDPSRINPAQGLKRLFSMQSVVTLLKALAKFAVIGVAVWMVMEAAWGQLLALAVSPVPAVPAVMRQLSLDVALASGATFLLVAAADYAWQWFQFEKQLRMTRQEVVQERREQDGDPLLKSRMQSMARAMTRRRMLGAVRTADVVVTNPTHIAVALKYDVTVSGAPIVVAMGERKLAERIKLIARQAGVPCVENRPLARALLSTGRVGQMIPPALYAAVAEVLAFVYRHRVSPGSGRRGSR